MKVRTRLGIGPAWAWYLVAEIMFGSGAGSVLRQMIAIKRYIEDFGLSRATSFSQRKVIRSCDHVGPRKQIQPTLFWGEFSSAPSQKQFDITP